MSAGQTNVANFSEAQKRWLFIGCFVSLIATSFGFVVRTQLIGEWGHGGGVRAENTCW